MSWDGFPSNLPNSLCRKLHKSVSKSDNENRHDLVKLPCMGNEGEQLAKCCIKKLKRCFKEPQKVKFKVLYSTRKMVMFCSNKDKIPGSLKSNCPPFHLSRFCHVVLRGKDG